MQETISVAVVIPHFNNPDGLARALQSVSEQTSRPSQTIIVDDKSAEHVRIQLRDIVRRFGGTISGLRLIELAENGGPATARNEAWNVASAEYLAFLDADDAWHPQKLEIQYGVMKAYPDTVLSSHRFDNSALPGPLTEVPEPYTLGLFPWLVSNRASTPSVMLKADISARFPEGERFSEDYQMWLSIVASGHKTKFIPLLLGRSFKPFYGHSGLSGELHKMELGQLRSIRRGLSATRSTQLLIPLASAWSILRYARRLALVARRKRREVS